MVWGGKGFVCLYDLLTRGNQISVLRSGYSLLVVCSFRQLVVRIRCLILEGTGIKFGNASVLVTCSGLFPVQLVLMPFVTNINLIFMDPCIAVRLSRNTNKMQLCNRIYYSKVY